MIFNPMNHPIRLRRYVRLRREFFSRVCALVVILAILAVQIINIATE
jgi:hypothetical protein